MTAARRRRRVVDARRRRRAPCVVVVRRCRASSRAVVVEVIYPEIRRYMASDLANMKQAAEMIIGLVEVR